MIPMYVKLKPSIHCFQGDQQVSSLLFFQSRSDSSFLKTATIVALHFVQCENSELSIAQAGQVSLLLFLGSAVLKDLQELKVLFLPVALQLGQVSFGQQIAKNQTFLCAHMEGGAHQ